MRQHVFDDIQEIIVTMYIQYNAEKEQFQGMNFIDHYKQMATGYIELEWSKKFQNLCHCKGKQKHIAEEVLQEMNQEYQPVPKMKHKLNCLQLRFIKRVKSIIDQIDSKKLDFMDQMTLQQTLGTQLNQILDMINLDEEIQ